MYLHFLGSVTKSLLCSLVAIPVALCLGQKGTVFGWLRHLRSTTESCVVFGEHYAGGWGDAEVTAKDFGVLSVFFKYST